MLPLTYPRGGCQCSVPSPWYNRGQGNPGREKGDKKDTLIIVNFYHELHSYVAILSFFYGLDARNGMYGTLALRD